VGAVVRGLLRGIVGWFAASLFGSLVGVRMPTRQNKLYSNFITIVTLPLFISCYYSSRSEASTSIVAILPLEPVYFPCIEVSEGGAEG
jgi:hypothetical protein